MARKAVLETHYSFNPSTRTVVIPRIIPRERLILITNVSTNQVIYNFSDPNLGASSYTTDGSVYQQGVSVSSAGTVTAAFPSTTVVLSYNTSAMNSTDKLQIIYDEFEERFVPAETFQDAVSKLRVSTPQSLIDTDFEYGLQPSKWEFVPLVQNYPTYYNLGTSGGTLIITSISGNNAAPRSKISVGTTSPHGLVVGDIVTVQETTNQNAEGTFAITEVGVSTFSYVAKGQINGSVLDTNTTTLYAGGLYPGATITMASAVGVSSATGGSLITVQTSQPHGLLPGTPISITGATTAGVNGNWVITDVPAPNQFKFLTVTSAVTTVTLGASARLCTSPEAYQIHRSLDGGVSVTTNGNFVGVQGIRQTRRQFRYQSGKAMQFSTGIKLTPTYDVDTISASGTTVTVTTLQDHNLQIGATIKIEGVVSANGDADSAVYNITTTVANVTGSKTFTYTVSSTPGDLQPGGENVFVTATKWKGTFVRSGLYDDQNGFFFEYDGNQLFACRRQTIKELFGKLNVTLDSRSVTGTGTRFLEQLVVGDMIAIKGRSYEVVQIASNTSMHITPSYRGPSNTNARYLKTQLFKVPQSAWNLDKMDGTGPSGYNLDVSKMQMAYIDYTWYGAGYIRFGFRAINGDVVYCHRMPNNNVNTSAYMRSGNLPARFEVNNFGYYSRLIAGAGGTTVGAGGTLTGRGSILRATDTTLFVDNAVNWPSSGHIFVNDANYGEVMSYTGIGTYNSASRGYPLEGLTRRTSMAIGGITTSGTYSSTAYRLTGISSALSFFPDNGIQGGIGTSQVQVSVISNTCAPTVSHWGVSVIMDGRQDDDKSIVFTTPRNSSVSVGAGQTQPIISIRIAPSVDSGNPRNFGIREVINRMQLNLKSIGVYATGNYLIRGVLNPSRMYITDRALPEAWNTDPVGSGSLSQVIYHNTGDRIDGGDTVFAFYTNSGNDLTVTAQDLSAVRDLGTGVLSGNGGTSTGAATTAISPGYPLGPDVLTITAENIGNPVSAGTSFTINAVNTTTEVFSVTADLPSTLVTGSPVVYNTGTGVNPISSNNNILQRGTTYYVGISSTRGFRLYTNSTAAINDRSRDRIDITSSTIPAGSHFILVTTNTAPTIFSRLSWTEAQA